MPELLNCPFCGGTNIALLNGGLGNRFVHCDDCRATTDDGSEERAIAAWNRRSSDEQAEVVGETDRAQVIEDCAEEIMLLAQSLIGAANRQFDDGDQGSAIISRFRGEGIKLAVELLHKQAADLRASSSPPAVAAGGVTEERVEAAARVIAERLGFNPKPGLFIEHREMARAALTAALAVGDEGIREVLRDALRFISNIDNAHPVVRKLRAALKDTTDEE